MNIEIRMVKKMKEEWNIPVEIAPIAQVILKDGQKIELPEGKMVIYDRKHNSGISIVSNRYVLIPHGLVLKTIMKKIQDISMDFRPDVRIVTEREGSLINIYFPIS